MTRIFLLAAGALVFVLSAAVLALSVLDGRFSSYLGSGGVVAAGIGLVVLALIVGIGMGRWRHPRPVPTSNARHHEGMQG